MKYIVKHTNNYIIIVIALFVTVLLLLVNLSKAFNINNLDDFSQINEMLYQKPIDENTYFFLFLDINNNLNGSIVKKGMLGWKVTDINSIFILDNKEDIKNKSFFLKDEHKELFVQWGIYDEGTMQEFKSSRDLNIIDIEINSITYANSEETFKVKIFYYYYLQ